MPIDDCVGEMATIENCSKVLTDLDGLYKLSPSEALKAYSQLSLYTTAEPCPMVRSPPPPLGMLAHSSPVCLCNTLVGLRRMYLWHQYRDTHQQGLRPDLNTVPGSVCRVDQIAGGDGSDRGCFGK